MQIQCPVCRETGETDETPAIGQHIICPYCQSKFSYLGDDENCANRNSANRDKCEIVANIAEPVEQMAEYVEQIAEPVEQIEESGDQVRHGEEKKMDEKKVCKECGNELHPKAVICPKCGCACSIQSQQKLLGANKRTIIITALMAIVVFSVIFIFLAFSISASNEPSNSELEHGVKERFLKETHAYHADFFAKAKKTGPGRWNIHFTVEYEGMRSSYDARAEMDNRGEIHYYMPILRIGEWGVGSPRPQKRRALFY